MTVVRNKKPSCLDNSRKTVATVQQWSSFLPHPLLSDTRIPGADLLSWRTNYPHVLWISMQLQSPLPDLANTWGGGAGGQHLLCHILSTVHIFLNHTNLLDIKLVYNENPF